MYIKELTQNTGRRYQQSVLLSGWWLPRARGILSVMDHLTKYLVEARVEDLRRDARRVPPTRVPFDARHRKREALASPITIRRAHPDNVAAPAHLAALDSSEVPDAPVFLATFDGELRAALSLNDGALVADPFQSSVPMVDLLKAAAAHLQTEHRPSWRGRVRRALGGRDPRRRKRDERRPAL
jgi:hypothetical protein